LNNVIQFGLDEGISKPEIAKRFNEENSAFGITRFRTDYILRQTGMGDSAIIEKNDMFYIDKSFLDGTDLNDWKEIIRTIDKKYLAYEEKRLQFYSEIIAQKESTIEQKTNFIKTMLLHRETEKKGQTFEVTAFAILKVFYSNRGFELNRFSTIYSNDGGIDYTSQTCIYQVTTLLNDTKFNEDIKKAPLKNRIFVFRNISPTFNKDLFDNDLVLDYIDTDDLLGHLNYLTTKKPQVNTNKIIDVILYEFQREFHKDS
jgi:hypothetical protein